MSNAPERLRTSGKINTPIMPLAATLASVAPYNIYVSQLAASQPLASAEYWIVDDTNHPAWADTLGEDMASAFTAQIDHIERLKQPVQTEATEREKKDKRNKKRNDATKRKRAEARKARAEEKPDAA
ncbi:hypothetical protein SLS57_011665 [Botryosphaeria dothidea]